MSVEDEVEAMVKTTIQAKIVQAFRDTPEAIDKLVEAALSKNVDEHGMKPDRYGRAEMPYLEWLVGDTIRHVARGAVVETIKAREPEIREAVVRAVSSDAIVDGLMKKILGTLDQDYKINVNFLDEEG